MTTCFLGSPFAIICALSAHHYRTVYAKYPQYEHSTYPSHANLYVRHWIMNGSNNLQICDNHLWHPWNRHSLQWDTGAWTVITICKSVITIYVISYLYSDDEKQPSTFHSSKVFWKQHPWNTDHTVYPFDYDIHERNILCSETPKHKLF